jgi:glycosyltransferase involved in cell wall biosynthesis
MEECTRIGVLVDNQGWCWEQRAKALSYYINKYDMDIVPAVEFKRMETYPDWDFLIMMGYVSAFVDERNISKMLPFMYTISTGGNNLPMRLSEIKRYAGFGEGVIVQNKTAYHECVKARLDNIFVIPNGVDLNLFYPAKEKPKMSFVGCAANVTGTRAMLKGTPLIIEACGKKYNYVEANSEDRLSPEEIADWYRALTIYAQPSDSEGCSNSVMEAMASGLPCLICKGVGYHGEVCLDGIDHEGGEVVFVERDPKDIRAKIKKLLNNKTLYKRISQNARRFAENHDWRIIARKYEKLFDWMKEKTKINIPARRKQQKLSELAGVVDQFLAGVKLPHNTQGVLTALDIMGYLSSDGNVNQVGYGTFNRG